MLYRQFILGNIQLVLIKSKNEFNIIHRYL